MRGLWGLLRIFMSLVIVAWGVATVTFLLMRAIPGGPLSRDRQLPQSVREAIERRYHLDEPAWKQYLRYLGEAVTGRFGLSYNDPGRTVGELIGQRIPVSAALGGLAMGLSLAMAFPLGIAGALGQRRWPDRLNAFVAAAGVSFPSFILGAMLLYLFAYRLGWFPASGWRGISTAFLPALALAAMPTAYLSRLIRSELSEVLRSDFLMTARAKGLSLGRVVVVHALRHTLSPVLAYLGPQAAGIMTGSFVVERIFNVPGLGQYFVTSITNRNYPMIMGVTLFYVVVLVSFNLLADAASRQLDPRLREAD